MTKKEKKHLEEAKKRPPLENRAQKDREESEDEDEDEEEED